LTGMAETGLKQAGEAILKLVDNVSLEEPQLRVLIRYYGSIKNEQAMDQFSRRLVELNNTRIERMTRALDIAINKKAVLRAKTLLTRIESMNPNATGLGELRKKVDALNNADSSAT
ncbi:MAG: hypothetical protein L0Z73_00810, partial [Gammaproteobacteria bacterium]|nr:hypothetical protein [Gammaproteobacteria bacterium]